MRGKKQTVLKAREILSDVKRTSWARSSFGFALVLFLSLCRTRSRLAYHKVENTSFQVSKEENSLSLKNHYFCSSNTEKLFGESLRVVLKLIACFGLRIFLIYIRDELIPLKGLGKNK